MSLWNPLQEHSRQDRRKPCCESCLADTAHPEVSGTKTDRILSYKNVCLVYFFFVDKERRTIGPGHRPIFPWSMTYFPRNLLLERDLLGSLKPVTIGAVELRYVAVAERRFMDVRILEYSGVCRAASVCEVAPRMAILAPLQHSDRLSFMNDAGTA